MTAATGAATSGMISGFGLAIAKTIGSRPMLAICSGCKMPGAETPIKTSTPANTRATIRGGSPDCNARQPAPVGVLVPVGAIERAAAIDRDHIAHARAEQHFDRCGSRGTASRNDDLQIL